MEMIKKHSRTNMMLIIIMSVIIGISATTTQVSAQSVSVSFNPQAQFKAGSSLTIQSVYGIGTAMPSRNETHGNPHHGNPPASNNQLQVRDQKPQENLQTYSASITVNVQVTADATNGGVQLTVQGGTIVINGVTFKIASGNGEISSFDQLTIDGTASGVNGQAFKWSMQGLTALYNGAVIGSLNGNAFVSIDSSNTPTDVNVTYITTIG
jgi:hypothetical protein